MILDERSLAWQREVTEMALRSGWTVFDQATRKQRHPAPSLVLFRANVVVLAYLRTTRRKGSVPDLERLATATGTRTVWWTPDDYATITAVLA